jgi:hypothetical protein
VWLNPFFALENRQIYRHVASASAALSSRSGQLIAHLRGGRKR